MRFKLRYLLFVFSIFALIAPQTVAEDTRLKRLDNGDDGRRWEAVGRLDIGGTGFCTGALISEDVVLTAAHCLYDNDTGKAVDISKIEFLAGWRNGRASAYRRVRKSLIHPDYDFNNDVTTDRVRNDIALLELHHPITNARVVPFPTDNQPRKNDQIGLVSYARDRAEAPSLQEICTVLGRDEGALVMSCDVNFGASGSPVFSFKDGAPHIVSVVSAMAEVDGQQVALGAQLTKALPMMREALQPANRTVGETRLFSSGKNRDTGAKFASPNSE